MSIIEKIMGVKLVSMAGNQTVYYWAELARGGKIKGVKLVSVAGNQTVYYWAELARGGKIKGVKLVSGAGNQTVHFWAERSSPRGRNVAAAPWSLFS